MRRVDGVEVDATSQHERVANFDFHTVEHDFWKIRARLSLSAGPVRRWDDGMLLFSATKIGQQAFAAYGTLRRGALFDIC